MRRFLPVALLLLFAVRANAACEMPGFRAEDGAPGLDAVRSSGFFSSGGCHPEMAQRIDRWAAAVLRDSANVWKWREHDVQDSVVVLVHSVEAWSLAELSPDAPGRATLIRKYAEWNAILSAREFETSPDEEWRVQSLKLFAGSDNEIDLGAAIDDCGSGASCTRVASDVAVMMTTAAQIRKILGVPWKNAQAQTVRHLESLEHRWKAYLLDSRAIYPWELALNSWLTRRAYSGRGFVGPPNSQWLFLHPDGGLQTVIHGSETLENVLLLEAIGFTTWKWKDDQIDWPLGLAIVTAWDGDRDRPLSYGALLHLPRNWSAGATWKKQSDRWQTRWVLSGDLGKLFTKRAELGRELVGRVLKEK